MQAAHSSAHESFNDRVNLQVIQPLIESISTTSSLATPTSDPAPIASACASLISTLHSYRHRITLDTLLRAVNQLHNLSQDVWFEAHTTFSSLDSQINPSHPQDTQSLPPLADLNEIAEYETAHKSAWDDLVKTWHKIVKYTRLHDTEYADLLILSLLMNIRKHRLSCLSSFPDWKHFDPGNDVQQEECHAFIRTSVANLVSKCPHVHVVRALPDVLRRLPLTSNTPIPAAPQEEGVLLVRLAEGIRRDYKGNAHRRLLNFVINVNRTYFHERPQAQRPYLKCTPIVQSSGTGKTRMVLQLGRISPLLFLCVRPTDSTVRNGYPLGDQPITSFVFEDCASSQVTSDEHAAVLLAAWFTTLASKLQPLSNAKAKSDFLFQLNNYGDESHRHHRHAFFQAVQLKARALLPPSPTPGGYKAIFDRHLNPSIYALSEQLQDVRNSHARDDLSADSIPVFVAIDECVTLPPTLLVSICRAWNHIGKLEAGDGSDNTNKRIICFWLLLMSTSSGASTLVRPQQQQSSDRDKIAIALPTFVGIGFDVLRTEQPTLQAAIQVASEKHIQVYGRPLWKSLVPDNFWATATYKLLGTQNFQRGLPQTCFNVLASRLALRYVPTRGASGSLFGEQLSFAHTAVDRHMRILVKVETDSTLHIRSPSEPVLAVAASLIMMPTPLQDISDVGLVGQKASNRYGSMLETLQNNCLASADINILKGTRGELMARLLLMTAWDATKISIPGFRETENEDWKAQELLKPVTLNAILNGLVKLDESSAETVRRRIDNACSTVQNQLGGAAKVQAWTHYTHFDILETKVEAISTEYLWYCWKRGVGIQMSHPQHGIDGIIPVYIGDLDWPMVDKSKTSDPDPEGEGRFALGVDETASSQQTAPSVRIQGEVQAARQMTYIAWEAKNRKKSGPAMADEAAAKPRHAGPTTRHATGDISELSSRGLLTLLADMGTTESHPPRVADIKESGSLQIWIRGVDGVDNYPCLDKLEIRNVAVKFLRTVSNYVDLNNDNLVPDPMALGNANLGHLARAPTGNIKGDVEDVEAMVTSSPSSCPADGSFEEEQMDTT